MGNVTPRFNNQIARFDHPMILASRRDLASLKGVVLSYQALGYVAGTVLGQITATKLWAPYAVGNSDGSQVAGSILFENADASEFPATSSTTVKVGIFGGEVFYDKLTGLDSGAITNLLAKSFYNVTGTRILKF